MKQRAPAPDAAPAGPVPEQAAGQFAQSAVGCMAESPGSPVEALASFSAARSTAPPAVRLASSGPSVTATPPMLEVRNLRSGYRERPVLQGVSFAARGGECLALLGPNGSGKTTLLRSLSGVLHAQEGEIFLQGRSLVGMKPRQRARLAAVVPQGGEYPRELTARQMALLGRYPYLSWLGCYGSRDYAAVDEALEACGAAALAPRRLAELSGGELQRVLLARALAQESPLLLLDELASGLDMARMAGLFDLLERRRAAGACVLMAVHDCNLAAIYATRLLGLKAGRLVFDGPVDAVFTEEKLSALYDIPIGVLPHPLWGLPQALLARAHGPRSHDGFAACPGDPCPADPCPGDPYPGNAYPADPCPGNPCPGNAYPADPCSADAGAGPGFGPAASLDAVAGFTNRDAGR